MAKPIENLTRELKERRIIYGSKVSMKQLKKNNVEKIYLTVDCPPEVEQTLENNKENANIIKLNLTKEALKDLCKLPFNVSVISVLKEQEEQKQPTQNDKEEKGKEEKPKREPVKSAEKKSTKKDSNEKQEKEIEKSKGKSKK